MSSITKLPLADNSRQVLRRLQDFYRTFSIDSLAGIDELYTRDVEFVDPVHRLHGSLALKGYFRHLATNLQAYEIAYLDCLEGPDSAYLSWELSYVHPRLNKGRVVKVRGMTHVRYTNRIFYHEDSYDLSALIHDQVPLLGTLTRGLRKRLGGRA